MENSPLIQIDVPCLKVRSGRWGWGSGGLELIVHMSSQFCVQWPRIYIKKTGKCYKQLCNQRRDFFHRIAVSCFDLTFSYPRARLPFTPPPWGIPSFFLFWTVTLPARRLVAHCPVKAHAQCPALSLSQQTLEEAVARDGSFYSHKEPHGEMRFVTRPWLRSFGLNSETPANVLGDLRWANDLLWVSFLLSRVEASALTIYSWVVRE